MDFVLRYGGDLLWAISLGLMANISRVGFRRIQPGTPTPAPWNFGGVHGPRAPRLLALTFTPAVAFVISVGLLYVAWTHRGADSQAVLIFGARALLASLFALVHVTHVRGALAVLQAEGKLRS
jgi:hypothetical protein